MSGRRAAVSSGIVVGLVAVGAVTWSLFAWQNKAVTPTEQLLPANPVLMYQWDGFKPHDKAWQATGAHKALVDSGLLKVVNKLLDFVVDEVDEPAAELAHKFVTRTFEKGVSLAATVDTSGAVPAPQVTLILHGAADLGPQLSGLLLQGPLKSVEVKRETIAGRAISRVALPGTPDYEVAWWTDGGHFVIVGGFQAVDKALEVAQGKAPNLTTNTVYKNLRTSKEFEVASVGFIDLGALLALAKDIDIPPVPDSGKSSVKVAAVLKALGVDRLGKFQGRWGFRNQALWSESFLEAPAPRTGLLTMLDQKPLSLGDLPPLPKGCDQFSVMRVDFSKFAAMGLALANQGLKTFAPEGTPAASEYLNQAQQVIGFHPLDDLVNPLGDMVVGYMDPSASGLFPAGAVAINVDEADKLKATLTLLQDKLLQLAGENVKVRSKELNGRQIQIIQIGAVAFLSPSWFIDNGWLVIGSAPQTVEAHIKRIDGKLPKWQAPQETVDRLKQLPEKFTAFSYSDPRGGIRSLLSLSSTGISIAEIGMVEWRKQREREGKKVDDSVEFPITAEDIPVSEEVTEPLFPNIAVGTVDDTGVKWQSSSSLPGIPLASGGGGGGVESVAVVGVLIALLLPAVQQAREAARRTQSKNNLKQIGLALHNYYATFNEFPTGTHPNDKLMPEERLSWLVDILPYLDQEAAHKATDFKKPWSDPGNKQALSGNMSVFMNPSQPVAGPVDGCGITHYVGIAGVGKDAPTLPITDNRVGVFGYNRVAKFKDITDGSSQTIMVTDASKDFGPWSRGGKSTIRAFTTKPYINGPDGLGSPHAGGMHVLFVDGSVRFVSQNVQPELLEGLATIHGGEPIGDF